MGHVRICGSRCGCVSVNAGMHAPMPTTPLSPMLASPGPTPSGAQWIFEWKWDGARGVAVIDGLASIKVFSRNGNDTSASYPEVTAALADAADGRSLIVDGELVALHPNGHPDFGLLQRRMHVKRPSESLLRSTPVSYFVFDLLEVDGESVRALPYTERRDILNGLELADGRRVQVPPNMAGVDGETLMEIASQHGIEGVVAKRGDSIYKPGTRSKHWIKTPLRRSRDTVVCGWIGTGGRVGAPLAALLLGAYTPSGELVYIGSVGTGFSDRTRRDLAARLAEIQRPHSPFSEAVPRTESVGALWCEPILVAIVEYREQSATGRLRHSSYKGLRNDDIDAHDVHT